MKWEKIGQIFTIKNNNEYLVSHASNPLPIPLQGNIFRIFYSGRNKDNKSSVGFVDIDIIRALSQSIEPDNLGRLAGDFSPKSQASLNTVLLDNDRIIVPKNPNAISIFGEVLNPIAMEYKKNLSLNSAINNAGGYQQYADKRRVYVIKANGIVKKASRNIFVRNVKLDPGDTIVVPRKIITQSPGIQALIPITQILSDLAFSAAALDNLQSN